MQTLPVNHPDLASSYNKLVQRIKTLVNIQKHSRFMKEVWAFTKKFSLQIILR